MFIPFIYLIIVVIVVLLFFALAGKKKTEGQDLGAHDRQNA